MKTEEGSPVTEGILSDHSLSTIRILKKYFTFISPVSSFSLNDVHHIFVKVFWSLENNVEIVIPYVHVKLLFIYFKN